MGFIEINQIDRTPARMHHPDDKDTVPFALTYESDETNAFRSKLRELRQQYYATSYEHTGIPRKKLGICRLYRYAVNVAPLIQFQFGDTPRDKIHTETNLPYGVRSWTGLAKEILVADSNKVVWDEAGITPFIRVDLIEKPDKGIIFSPFPFKYNLGNFILTIQQWPLMRGEIDGVAFYKPCDPNLISYLTAAPYFWDGYKDAESIIDNLTNDGLLSPEMISRSLPAISMIAEFLLFQETDQFNYFDTYSHPFEFRKFIFGIMEKVGKEKGRAAASAILEDIKEADGPLLYGEGKVPLKYLWQRSLLETTEEKLQTAKYLARPKILPIEVIRSVVSMSDISGTFDSAFARSGAVQVIPTLFPEKVNALISPILQESLEKRKAEAGMILLLSDFIGHLPKETVIRLAALMQVLWAVIINKDNHYDHHKIRDGKDTLEKLLGTTDAAEMSLLGMIEIINASATNNISDVKLGERFREMISKVYQGDIKTRSLCWNKENNSFKWDFENKKYVEAFDEIAEIFYWFPYYFMEQRHNQDLGPGADFSANLVIFTRHLGQLILQVNDLEDFACEDKKHDGGNDIATKVSSPWKMFMDLRVEEVIDPLKDDLTHDQQRTKVVWDKLGAKRRNGEELTETESLELEEMKVIAKKYLPVIAERMKEKLKGYYDVSKDVIETLRTSKPIDESNLLLLDFFEQYVNGLWNKIDKYANS